MTNSHEPTRFDKYEISGVREFGRGKKRFCEQVEDEEAQFWSLYGHIPGQGLECIGDFKTREMAEEIYARITGRPYGNPQPLDAAEADIDIHELLVQRRQVAVIWSTEDVQGIRSDLTDDQAWQVLQHCRDHHDCELGFNWLLIETVAEDLFPEPASTEE